MKTLRYIGMALVAITLTFGLASCGGDDDDDITPDTPTEDPSGSDDDPTTGDDPDTPGETGTPVSEIITIGDAAGVATVYSTDALASADESVTLKAAPTSVASGTNFTLTCSEQFSKAYVSMAGKAGHYVVNYVKGSIPRIFDDPALQHQLSITLKDQLAIPVLISVMTTSGKMSNTVSVTVEPSRPTDDTTDEHEWVDLGLTSGTKWATTNIGASTAEGYGDYFAWGETVPYGQEDKSNDHNYSYTGSYTKSIFSWGTYKWSSSNTLTKYCTQSYYGTVDNKAELDREDDAAYVNWGSNWRMPSNDQMQELIDECTWTWETISGVDGYRVTSKKNSNSIFLPAAGLRRDGSLITVDTGGGNYWSRTLDSDYSYYAYRLYLNSSYDHDANSQYRYFGRSVRPVLSATE